MPARVFRLRVQAQLHELRRFAEIAIRCFYYADRGSCSKCYISCRTCSGPRRDQCASCPSGWKLAAGECHPECPQDKRRLPTLPPLLPGVQRLGPTPLHRMP
ncbi:unnamed protein product [Leptidea sinapis]|uniref:R-spondin Fu-CRD domain-containing protein n=1 Tax=Leptidea sinapis TaxID=189913 RepID=A0A5E4R185_9NEOP|nr:unnamed protein product [Leptidea sinapis]